MMGSRAHSGLSSVIFVRHYDCIDLVRVAHNTRRYLLYVFKGLSEASCGPIDKLSVSAKHTKDHKTYDPQANGSLA